MPTHVRIDSDLDRLLPAIVERAYRVALRLGRSPEEAEALLKETVAEARRRYASDSPGAAFGLWFYRLLVGAFAKARSRKPKEPRQAETEEATELFLYQETQRLGMHSQSRDPALLFMSKLLPEQIAAAVDILPDEHRLLLTLYLYEDLRYVELAAIVGASPSTVRSRLHRARNMFQRTLWRVACEAGLVEEQPAGTNGT